MKVPLHFAVQAESRGPVSAGHKDEDLFDVDVVVRIPGTTVQHTVFHRAIVAHSDSAACERALEVWSSSTFTH